MSQIFIVIYCVQFPEERDDDIHLSKT
jgi:hypothetical protein